MNFRPGSGARHYAPPGLRAIPTHDSDLARRPPATTPPPANPRNAKSSARYLAPSKPRTNSGAPTISPGRQLKGTDSESLHVQGTTTQLRSPTCGTAKHRPEHGTKPDFDIRLIPPYADDHSSCLAQAPSWISRLAAYGPGPSAWSPGSLAHPPHLMAPPLSRTIVVYSRRAQCASGS